jgi:hypothetical protein
MGKPLMIQLDDEKKINDLKERLGAKTKIEVVREGLRLLDSQVRRQEKIRNWKRVAGLVAESSKEVNQEFQKHSRLRRSK